MSYKQEPWTLKEKTVKADIKKKREGQPNFFKENDVISEVKIIDFFRKNPTEEYTNHEIATALGLSVGTVSAITNRMQQSEKIKITKIHGPARVQYFQHITGPGPSTVKTMENGDTSIVLMKFFEEHKEQLFTKEEIFKELKDRSKSQIEHSLRIRVLSGQIKICNEALAENNTLRYCYPSENINCLPVIETLTEEYSRLNPFLKEHNVKCTPEILKNLPKGALYFSKYGLQIVYPREELKKAVSKSIGIVRKLRNALGV